MLDDVGLLSKLVTHAVGVPLPACCSRVRPGRLLLGGALPFTPEMLANGSLEAACSLAWAAAASLLAAVVAVEVADGVVG